jgi:hypothetical protein
MATRFQTYSKNVKLAPGQALKFTKGRGYYAGPSAAPSTPPGVYVHSPGLAYNPPRVVRVPVKRPGGPTAVPPPVDPYGPRSPEEIDRLAGEQAQAGLTPQQAEVRRQQALATAQAAADEAAITGFQTAAGGSWPGSPLRSRARTTRPGAPSARWAQASAGPSEIPLRTSRQRTTSSPARRDSRAAPPRMVRRATSSDYLGGVLPGTSIEEQGAAMATKAARDVQIPLNAGREELDARMAQARSDNDKYAQQLIDIAAKYPDLKAQALQQLNQYEIDKANYRESARVNTANIKNANADNARQNRAERANEIAAGVSATIKKGELKYRWAALEFQSQKELNRAKSAAAKGKRIDTSASKLLGHIVYMDGSEDPSIKVKQTSTTSDPVAKAKQNKAKAVQAARTSSFSAAKATFGKPTPNKNQGLLGGPGKYIAAPGAKGVFPKVGQNGVATTNDPSKAARTGGAADYAQAQQQVWAAIAGDSLMSRYGMSKEQVMAIVNRSLAAAGWKR